nr:hypothetical protein [Tanacetum cinerariifolium]
SNSHNIAFVSSENTSSINETVNVAHDIPAAGLKEQPSASSYADDVMSSFFASQSNTSQSDNEDLEKINTKELEEMDLKWQVAMITMKGNRSADNERRVVSVENPASALVVQDGLGGYDWSYQAEEGPTDFVLMAHSSDSTNSSNYRNEMPKCEIFKTKSDSSVSEIDEDNNQAKDRYKVRIGYHAVPPPYTGNYMPPRVNLSFAGLDDFVFMFKISETRTSVNENESIASKSTEEIREEPKTVRSSASIIED